MSKLTNYILPVLLVSTAACVERHIEDEYDFAREVTHLDVKLDATNINVKPSRDDSSSVVYDVDYRGGEPDIDVEVKDHTLKVRMNCHFSCDGRFDIRVPRQAASKLSVDSGNIQVDGLEGPATLRADSGNIKLDGVSGELDLDLDSGSVSGTVGSTVCYGDVDSGNITLHFDETPKLLDLFADSGNLRMEVPKGTYNIKTSVDSGSRDIDGVGTDPDADNTIRASVDSGRIVIDGY